MENQIRKQIKRYCEKFKGDGSMVIAREGNLTLSIFRNSADTKSSNLLNDNFYFLTKSKI